MCSSLLTVPDRKELLSQAYVRAVAAFCGYTTAIYDLDRDGIDMRIQASGEMRPALELQLKATVNLRKGHSGSFRFRLKRRNYDLLRIDTQTPRLLVVLDLPDDEDLWLAMTVDSLVLRRCAYWLSLRGSPPTTNHSSITVEIPRAHLFDVDGLRALMRQSRRGVVR